MATFIYGAAAAVTMNDRVLKHLQAVIVTKLRRRESFAFSWDQEPGVGEDPAGDGGRHGTVWVSDASQLYFAYDGPRTNGLNRAWLKELMLSANSVEGLRALPEPVEDHTRNGEGALR